MRLIFITCHNKTNYKYFKFKRSYCISLGLVEFNRLRRASSWMSRADKNIRLRKLCKGCRNDRILISVSPLHIRDCRFSHEHKLHLLFIFSQNQQSKASSAHSISQSCPFFQRPQLSSGKSDLKIQTNNDTIFWHSVSLSFQLIVPLSSEC